MHQVTERRTRTWQTESASGERLLLKRGNRLTLQGTRRNTPCKTEEATSEPKTQNLLEGLGVVLPNVGLVSLHKDGKARRPTLGGKQGLVPAFYLSEQATSGWGCGCY